MRSRRLTLAMPSLTRDRAAARERVLAEHTSERRAADLSLVLETAGSPAGPAELTEA